jgi:hypothetical protein
MIAKCECQNCGQAVEFEAADFEFNTETSHRKSCARFGLLVSSLPQSDGSF